MKKVIIPVMAAALLSGCGQNENKTTLAYGSEYTLTKEVMQDKIKGGWAGQTIGCTYGGPTEFKYRGAIIHEQTPIPWYDDYAYETFIEDPGLYDDVYMDLTFVEVMAEHGIDAPAEVFATAFANADYKLWHANQAARYNILNGILPPESGHWRNNPHADDIDFQIEADFIGMICPGMPNTASEIADRIGHIMNYGDGWYGGVYMAAMYSLAFVTDDMVFVVEEALKTIPPQSKFRKCIEDVIVLWKKYPDDWMQCWLQIERDHAFEIGCPEGVFNAFNIDATINAAYVVIGLLYGGDDFFKVMDISTRCGQDSDCNPATAAGIWGVMYGYSSIPDFWKPGLEKVEKLDFPYTSISLERIYDLNLELLGDNIAKNGGRVEGESYVFTLQQPEEVRWEVSFEGHFTYERRVIKQDFNDEITLDFTGNAVVLMGLVRKTGNDDSNYIAQLEAYIDGRKVEEFAMPYDYIKRKYDIFHTYDLVQGDHTLKIVWKNPHSSYTIETKDMVVYADGPSENYDPYK